MHRTSRCPIQLAAWLAGALAVGACEPASDSAPGALFVEIADSIPPSPEIEEILAPYRAEMEAELAEVVAQANGPFEKAEPEGTLDNLVADAVLHVARQLAEDTVHVSMLNDGGLRVPLARGPLRVNHAFELLPFRNYVVVLTLSGDQMEQLADQIAATGGEPVAGWTMALADGEAIDVRVGGEPVDRDAEYRLATIDYLADGGGSWSELWEPKDGRREDLGILIRDAFMCHLRQVGEVTPELDGRIRMAGDEAEPDEAAADRAVLEGVANGAADRAVLDEAAANQAADKAERAEAGADSAERAEAATNEAVDGAAALAGGRRPESRQVVRPAAPGAETVNCKPEPGEPR